MPEGDVTEPVGRHASHDPGETLILAAIASGAEPEYNSPPSAGRHASSRSAVNADRATAERLIVAGDGWPAAGQAFGDQPVVPAPRALAPESPAVPESPAAVPESPGAAPESPGAAPGSLAEPPESATASAATESASAAGRPIRLVWVFPDLLSTYGDRGNLLVLTRRAQLRDIQVEAIEVNSDQPVPDDGDIYLLGGGEDLPQILAASRLRADGGLARAAERGAVVFAVCAGYQLVGREFGGVDGERLPGLGILDVTSGRGERRGVGEIVADVDPTLGVPRLTGFENHQGVTKIGPGARPLAQVTLGVGNGDGTEGAYAGNVLGTYMHGPALARNPGLADLLLSWVAGPLQPLHPVSEEWAGQLRAERLAATANAN
jgi:CobQ-like glutamine amidotransferase family enzyme